MERGGVKFIDPKVAVDFLMPRHYAGRRPPVSKAFGWYVDGELKAVCTYGKPAAPKVCEGILGTEWKNNVYELNRLCRTEDFDWPLSYFVAQTLRMLKPFNWIIISYSDTAMHHNGYIYQACNFLYTGQTKARTDIFPGFGKHGRHYLTSDLNNEIRILRSAKNRYVYFCTNDKHLREEWLAKMRWPILPYPKDENQHYILGEYMRPTYINKYTGEILDEKELMSC